MVSVTIHDDTHILTFFTYMYMYMYVVASMYMSMHMSFFRDLESGLSKDVKDGERSLRRANAGGGSWRH